MSKLFRFAESIVFEDSNLIIINKPAGISSLDERNSDAQSILSYARKYATDAQLCHRLDKETSGALVIAKNPEAYREMSILFENRQVTKNYHAVIEGRLEVKNKSVILPLSVTRNGLAKVDMKEGKQAETIFTTLAMSDHFSLMQCSPVTGRLHQIRIHLSSQHFPIMADTSYGAHLPYLSRLKRDFHFSKWSNEEPMIKRVALHAYSILFTFGDKKIEAVAPYPKDIEVLLKLLTKYDHLVELN